MKSKIWHVLLILLLGTMMVSACATPTATAPVDEGAETDTGEVKESSSTGEQVTLNVWYLADPGLDWVSEIAKPEFEKANPGIKINLVAYPEEEYGLKIETAVAAKEAPDVGLLVLFNAPRVAPAGGLLDLAPMMNEEGFTTGDFCPSIYSRFNFLGDSMYALPMDTNIWAMMINKDLFSDAALPELTEDSYITYTDWLDYTRKITQPSDDLEQFVWGSAFFWPRWNSMNNYMSNPFFLGDDGKTCVGNADTQDWVDFYTASLSAYNEGLMPDTYSTVLSSYQMLDLFNQGKLGMIYGTLGQAIQAREAGINVGLTGQPVISKGWEGNVGSWESSWSIFADSKHPEESWKFIRYLAEEGALIVANSGKGLGAAAMPCFLPAQQEFIETSKGDMLVEQAIKLLSHVKSPPWTVDAWSSSTPFEEAWRRMTEDKTDIQTAINDAAQECQTVTESLWAEWETIGN